MGRKERYGIEAEPGTPGYELLELAGRRRGYLISGGEINTERMAKVLVDEYRSGKLGKITFGGGKNLHLTVQIKLEIRMV